jgi:hypothetical protein
VLFADRCRSCWPLTTELASAAETEGSQLLVLTTDIENPAARRARQSGLRARVAYDVDHVLSDEASADSVAVLVRADGRSLREWSRQALTVESARAALAAGS